MCQGLLQSFSSGSDPFYGPDHAASPTLSHPEWSQLFIALHAKVTEARSYPWLSNPGHQGRMQRSDWEVSARCTAAFCTG